MRIAQAREIRIARLRSRRGARARTTTKRITLRITINSRTTKKNNKNENGRMDQNNPLNKDKKRDKDHSKKGMKGKNGEKKSKKKRERRERTAYVALRVRPPPSRDCVLDAARSGESVRRRFSPVGGRARAYAGTGLGIRARPPFAKGPTLIRFGDTRKGNGAWRASSRGRRTDKGHTGRSSSAPQSFRCR